MTEPGLHDDDELLRLLGGVLAADDPVPSAAVDAALAAFDLARIDGELAELVSDSAAEAPLASVRHGGDDGRIVSFAASALGIDVDLPADQPIVVGQLDPSGPTEVELEVAVPDGRTERVVLPVDDLGRFQGQLPEGAIRLRVVLGGGVVVTPWILR